MKKIFLGGLPKSVTDEKLRDAFSSYGGIVDFVVMKDPRTKESRGFGFIEFDSEEPVNKILNARPHMIQNREIEVRRAMPKEITHNTVHERTRRLFIGGLSYDVTDEMLTKYYTEKFSKYGNLESAEVKRERDTNKSRGFGFITFDTEDAVDAILIVDPRPTIFGRNCEVKKSEPKRDGSTPHKNERARYRSPPPKPSLKRLARFRQANDYNQEYYYGRSYDYDRPYYPPYDTYEGRPSRYYQDPYAGDPYTRGRNFDRSPLRGPRYARDSSYYDNYAPVDRYYQPQPPQVDYDRYASAKNNSTTHDYRPERNNSFRGPAHTSIADSSQNQGYGNVKKTPGNNYDHDNRGPNKPQYGHYDSNYRDRDRGHDTHH